MSLRFNSTRHLFKKVQTKDKSKKAFFGKCLFLTAFSAYVITLLPNALNIWINVSPSILFCLDKEIAKLTADRHYVTAGNCAFQSAPIGKKVVAAQGDLVKIDGDGIEINGVLLTYSKPSEYDNLQRRMPVFSMHRYLDNDEFIVASAKNNSYDSRYFGIVKGEQIKGVIETIIPS